MTSPSSRSTSTPRPPMNRYGRMAWDQWERHRPNEVAAMSDPMTEFTNLGRLIANEIANEITTRLTADPTLDEQTVEAEVTEIVLADLVWSQTTRDSSDSTPPHQTAMHATVMDATVMDATVMDAASMGERAAIDETLVEEIPIAFDDTTNLQRWAASPLTRPSDRTGAAGER